MVAAWKPSAGSFARVLTTALILVLAWAAGWPAAAATGPAPGGPPPLAFEPNLGQADPSVKFLARGRGYGLFLTPTEAVLVLAPGDRPRARGRRPGQAALAAGEPAVVRMRLVGASPRPSVTGRGELPGRRHYFVGPAERWRRDVPTFARVQYSGVYPGVGLVFYGREGELEYDFVVAPGADPGVIELAFDGVQGQRLDAAGDLRLATAAGEVRLRRPVLYQEAGGGRRPVEGAYRLDGGRVRFHVGAWDIGRPLVIDPVLAYSTYLGGSGSDQGHGIAVDGAGNAYVTGSTVSAGFPVTGAAVQRATGGGTDAFVAKLDPAGSALVYATYLGGGGADVGNAVAVDADGNAYVAGATTSTDFPVVNAFQSTTRGGSDAFVAKLDPAGSTLVYSTYLGSSTDDFAFGLALDGAGNAYVTGSTLSATFPNHGAVACLGSKAAGADAFVARLDASGASVGYCRFVGGDGTDVGHAVAADASGAVWVAGSTTSTDLPVVSPLQPALAGRADAFVGRLDAAGGVVYLTYLGGGDDDEALGIAADATGSAYVTGVTASASFPTQAALQPASGGGTDAFVARLSADGTALVFSTYLGGGADDVGNAVAVHPDGSAVYVAGSTASADFPVAEAVQDRLAGGLDAFALKLAAAGDALVYATYLGGTGDDAALALAVDAEGVAHLTGATGSTAFPTARPLRGLAGVLDAFVAQIAEAGVIQFSAAAYQASETSASVTIGVQRAGDTARPATVQFATSDGTATAGADYEATAGTLTFGAGQTAATFTVTLRPDAVCDGDETVNLTLSDPGGGSGLGLRRTAVLTLVEPGTCINFSAPTYQVAEHQGPAQIVVARSGSVAGAATVRFSTSDGTARAPGDYTAVTDTTLTFAPGMRTVTVPVRVVNDAVAEGPETVNLTLTQTEGGPPLGARGRATLTIRDEDLRNVIQLGAAAYQVSEGGGAVTITVLRAGDTTQPATVQYATSDGTATAGLDYEAASGTLTFAPGQTSRTFVVTVLPDALCDGDETVNLSLSSPTGGPVLGRRTAVLTLVEAAACINFTAATYQVAENRGTAAVTVARSGPTVGTVTVELSTADGTATAPADYTALAGRVLTFAPGVRTVTASVPIVNDRLVEGAETVRLTLASVQGAAAAGTRLNALLDILDDDVGGVVQLAAATYTVTENAGVARVTVSRAGSTAGGATVRYATADGTATAGADYTATTGTLTFGVGETTRTFEIPIIDDGLAEGVETLTVMLSDPGPNTTTTLGARTTADVRIVDDELSVSFGAATPGVREGGTATVAVELTGVNTTPVTVRWSTADGTATAGADYGTPGSATPPSGVLTFPPGGTPTGVRSKTFTIRTLQDALIEPVETVALTLSDPVGAQLGARPTATLSITDDDRGGAVQFGVATYTVAESAGMALVTVTRSGSSAGGATVDYATGGGTATAGSDYTAVSGTLTFGVGETSQTFAVPILDDGDAEGVETVTLTLANPGPAGVTTLGTRPTAVLRIVDDELAVAFAAPSLTVREGAGTATLTVELTGVNATPVTVNWTAANGTATAGADYGASGSATPPSGTLTFAPGGTPTGVRTRTFTVRVLQDTVVEDTETFTLTLGGPVGAQVAAGRGAAEVSITDDEPSLAFSAPTYSTREAAGTALVTVEVAGVNTAPLTVGWTTSDGTATAGADYGTPRSATPPSGTVVFPPGGTPTGVRTKTFPVRILPDRLVEDTETVSLALSSSGARLVTGRETATLSIADDETGGVIQLGAVAYTVAEGAGTARITVIRTGSTAAGATVDYATADGTATAGADYTATSGTLTFGEGETTKTFLVPITPDAEAEGVETVLVMLTSPGPNATTTLGARTTATLRIVDSALALAFSTGAASVREAAGTATLTVELTGTNATPVTVDWTAADGTATAGADYGTTGSATPPSGRLTFAPGGSPTGVRTRNFAVRILPDTLVEGPETLTLTLSNPVGAQVAAGRGTAELSILDDDLGGVIEFSMDLFGATECAAVPCAAQLTVRRTGGAASNVTVDFATADGTATAGVDYAATAGTLTFAAGQASQVIRIPLLVEPGAEPLKSFTVTLTNPGAGAGLGARATAEVRITDTR